MAKKKMTLWYGIGVGLDIFLQVIACILIGLFLGFVLDNIFNSEPICLIIFLLLGVGAAFRNVLQIVKKVS